MSAQPSPHPDETNGQCFSRISDKYRGVGFCEMTTDELDEFLGAVARRGAADALKAVGLDDENAVSDIRDLRDILRGFRVVRKNVLMSTLAGFGRIIGWVIVIILAGVFVNHSPVAAKLIKLLPE